MNNKDQKSIAAIKTFLINSDRNLLTITEGLKAIKQQAGISMSRHDFTKLVERNLLIKTELSQKSLGSPRLYKLNELFLTENSYRLEESEIKLLLDNKKSKLKILNTKVEEIQKQKKKLNQLYRLALKINR